MNQKPSIEGFFCSSEVQGSEVQLIMKLTLRDPLRLLPFPTFLVVIPNIPLSFPTGLGILFTIIMDSRFCGNDSPINVTVGSVPSSVSENSNINY